MCYEQKLEKCLHGCSLNLYGADFCPENSMP